MMVYELHLNKAVIKQNKKSKGIQVVKNTLEEQRI